MHRVVANAQQRSRLSRSACRPAKAVGKLSRAKFGRLSFGAQGANNLVGNGVGIQGYRDKVGYSSLWGERGDNR